MKSRTLRHDLRVNEGHDLADEVHEADPDGRSALHAVVKSQRACDRLFAAGEINAHQHQAATELRNAWEAARVGPAGPRTRSLEYLPGGGQVHEVGNEDARARYDGWLRQVDPSHRAVVRAVVCYDEEAWAWGRQHNCHGPTALRAGLDMLARAMGLM